MSRASAPIIAGLSAGLAAAGLTVIAGLAGLADPRLAVPVFAVVAPIVAAVWDARRFVGRVDIPRLERRIDAVARKVDRQGGQAIAVASLAGRHEYPLRFGNAWALSGDTAVVLVQEMLRLRPRLVMEVGSGVSTVLVASELERLGSGRIVSFEHEPDWVLDTQRHLAAAGLSEVATVTVAPLSVQQVDGRSYQWYTLPADMPAPGSVDLLIVDGPPQSVDVAGSPRYPALPLLEHLLSERAVVFVDDGDRRGEQQMVDAWLATRPAWTKRTVDTVKGTIILERRAGGLGR
ncbi:MAG: class I SAM-dependent methyltransferase [Chloroflexi bacterium]|nr:class I SAM-dependent methyltransferase [Chloroflexota bacterium]